MIRRRHINTTMLNNLTILRVCCGKRTAPSENRRKRRGRPRGDVKNDEHGCGRIGGKHSHHALQSLNATGGCANYDDIPFHVLTIAAKGAILSPNGTGIPPRTLAALISRKTKVTALRQVAPRVIAQSPEMRSEPIRSRTVAQQSLAARPGVIRLAAAAKGLHVSM